MQDVHQIEAFSIPIGVELTELMELHFDFVLNCAGAEWRWLTVQTCRNDFTHLCTLIKV